MIEKKVRMRSQQKHDVEANWNRAAAFIPMAGEFVVYDPDENYAYARLKVGDGITSVVDLPFILDYNGTDELPVTVAKLVNLFILSLKSHASCVQPEVLSFG